MQGHTLHCPHPATHCTSRPAGIPPVPVPVTPRPAGQEVTASASRERGQLSSPASSPQPLGMIRDLRASSRFPSLLFLINMHIRNVLFFHRGYGNAQMCF